MASRVFIYPYNAGSGSVEDLKKALDIKQIKLDGSVFRPTARKVIINWGSSAMPDEYLICRILNKRDAVAQVIDKEIFFNTQSRDGGGRLVEWTTDVASAIGWFDDGAKIIARTNTRGRAGDGILLIDPAVENDRYVWERFGNEVATPPLFTKYIGKRIEFRCHFTKTDPFSPFLVQQKRHKQGDKDADKIVRSHENGWLLTREDVNPHRDVIEQAAKSFIASELDFGAVDVIFSRESNLAYVLEINSAPGLEGSTVHDYAGAMRKLIPELEV